jgi:glc operon protein GlcG
MAVHKGVGHYGAPITLDQAKKVMAAAEAKALQNNWYVAISIMDSGGNPVMLIVLMVRNSQRFASPKVKPSQRLSFADPPKRWRTLSRAAARG